MNKYLFTKLLMLICFQLQAGKYNLYSLVQGPITMYSTLRLCGHDALSDLKAKVFQFKNSGTFGEDNARGFYIIKGVLEKITYDTMEKSKSIELRAYIKEDDVLVIENDDSDKKSGLKVKVISKKEFEELTNQAS